MAALATGLVAARYGLRPQPFYLGVAFVAAGLLLSALVVRESHAHARHEAQGRATGGDLSPRELFWRTSLRDRDLSAVSQAGLVNNLNDGMAWGLFPLFFAAAGMDLRRLGWLAAIGDVAHPAWRASAVGVYRLWRDLGYAAGALLAGVTADLFGVRAAIWAVAAITSLSGLVVAVRMRETRRRRTWLQCRAWWTRATKRCSPAPAAVTTRPCPRSCAATSRGSTASR